LRRFPARDSHAAPGGAKRGVSLDSTGAYPVSLWILFLSLSIIAFGPAEATPKKLMESPQLLKVNTGNGYLQTEYEERKRSTPYTEQKGGYQEKTSEFRPTVGLNAEGSLYHPNLLVFDLGTELGISKVRGNFKTQDGSESSQDSNADVKNFNGHVSILREKPISVDLFGNRYTTRRDYDGFQSADVYTESYGAGMRHANDFIPWSVMFTQVNEDIEHYGRVENRDEKKVNFDARNTRDKAGNTSLKYDYNEFSDYLNNSVSLDGRIHHLLLADEEYFNPGRGDRLSSVLFVDDITRNDTRMASLNANEFLSLHHKANLWSDYIYRFRTQKSEYLNQDTGSTDQSTLDSHIGELALNHQLYESLKSRLSYQMESVAVRGDESGENSTRQGPKLDEVYNKKVGDYGRITIGFISSIIQEKSQSAGGKRHISRESATLNDGRLTSLREQDIDLASVVVSDSSGAIVYLRGADYNLFQDGRYTRIQRVFAGTIPDGTTVMVDYDTSSNPSRDLTVSDQSANVDVMVLDGLLTVYGRSRLVRSSGEGTATYPDMNQKILGARSVYHWLDVGIESENTDSAIQRYKSLNRYAGATFRPIPEAYWRFEVSQRNITYPDTGTELISIRYYLDGSYQPIQSLQFRAHGGLYQESGLLGERNLSSATAEMDYILRKFRLRVAYNFENATGDYQQQKEQRLYIQGRREF